MESDVAAVSSVVLTAGEWVGAASMEGYHRIAGGDQRATLLETERAWLAATKVTLRPH